MQTASNEARAATGGASGRRENLSRIWQTAEDPKALYVFHQFVWLLHFLYLTWATISPSPLFVNQRQCVGRVGLPLLDGKGAVSVNDTVAHDLMWTLWSFMQPVLLHFEFTSVLIWPFLQVKSSKERNIWLDSDCCNEPMDTPVSFSCKPEVDWHFRNHTTMSLSASDEISKMAYEGNFPLFRLKVDNDKSCATKIDSVCMNLLFKWGISPRKSLRKVHRAMTVHVRTTYN